MNRYRTTLIGLSLLFGSHAYADLEDALDSMFITTGNEPTIYQSQRRMGMDFGSLRLRSPINTYQLVNLTPPTLRMGCGGIDAYGGSFTFINEEQFRQMLRQIGANALGYAFKLALASMCEKCDSILTGLQNTVNAMNRMQINTCKMAQGFVNDFTKAWPNTFEEKYKTRETALGQFEDMFDAMEELFVNGTNVVSDGHASGADPDNRTETGNFTWNAVRYTTAASGLAFSSGNISNEELMMNIAGTFIFGRTTAAGDRTPYIFPRLTYDEFKSGKAKNSDQSSDEVPMLQCDEAIMCMDPTDLPNWSFAGVTEWAEARLQLAADHMKTPATAGTDHPPEIQEFLANLPFPIVTHLMALQAKPGPLDAYVQHVKHYVAEIYASHLALTLVKRIEIAYEDENTPIMPDQVKQALFEFKEAALSDKEEVTEKFSEVWMETEDLVAKWSKPRRQRGTLLEQQ